MRTEEFDYQLPDEAIAQVPAEPRDAARLLVDMPDGVQHRHVSDLPDLVGPGDVVVLNDTKVMPARLALHKATGGAVEVLVLEPAADGWWQALVRPSRRVATGSVLHDDAAQPLVEVGGDGGEGRRLVRAVDDHTMESVMAQRGSLPLPPYIVGELSQPDRYQTVYARHPASAAAPTAGLHLTDALLDRLRARGAVVTTLELRVGLGTFRPVITDTLEEHQMHRETYLVPDDTWSAVEQADRVIAVGTTVVRALESVRTLGPRGGTELFITPGHRFEVVDALLTNFHMPRSSLLVLLHAFMGPRWRDLYEDALASGYRFLSLGDAMFVERARDADGQARTC